VDEPLLPIMFGEQYQSRSSSICDFLQYPVTFCFFGPVGNDNQVTIFASDLSVDDRGHKDDWWILQGGQQNYSTTYSCDVVSPVAPYSEWQQWSRSRLDRLSPTSVCSRRGLPRAAVATRT